MNIVKLAQPGYDVKTAGDENLIYSSQWPLLKIYKEGSATVTSTETVKITDHDLGYPAMYWFFTNNALSTYLGSAALTSEERSEFFGPAGDNIDINSSQLRHVPSTTNPTGQLKLYYYIFALDLTQEFKAPIIKVGAIGGGDSKGPVFKIAKPNKDISSDNLQDYIIHSRARSPLIHQVAVSPGTVKRFVVNHDLGYNPMFFGYVKSGGYYKLIATGQGGSSSFNSDNSNITFTDTAGKEITVVVLKDPFILDYSVGVTI